MLGILRFLFAIFVVIAHLTEGIKFFSHWGVFAVFGFYLISGYLITLILNEVYKFDFISFSKNRFLRLFPTYYILGFISLSIIYLSNNASSFHTAWTINNRFADIAGNLFIFPFSFYDSNFRIIPPTWSIAVELINYFFLWLFIARNKLTAMAVIILSIGYHAWNLYHGGIWTERYVPFYAALLPFSMGAYIYFLKNTFRDKFSKLTLRLICLFSLTIFLINLVICGIYSGLGGGNFDYYFYINFLSVALVVLSIVITKDNKLLKKIGKSLGDLSYPIFLTHWIIGYIVGQVFLNGQLRGLLLLACSLPLIVLISYFLSKLVDNYFEPIRNVVRENAIAYLK